MAVILAQTDTTVGFLSQDAQALYEIKSRADTKPFITVFDTFASLKESSLRVPKKYKKLLRNTNKKTFIVKNRAFRVAHLHLDSCYIRNLHWTFSTSANESGKNFEHDFCESKADIIIEDYRGLSETNPSTIYKLGQRKKRRLR